MRKFVSLPYKIMGPLMALLLMASLLITLLWVNKNNQDYDIQQQKLRQQDQKQFEFIREMLRNRMESWLESFIHFQASHAETPSDIAKNFKNEFDYMQLNWQINNLWIFSAEQELVFSTTNNTPNDITNDVAQVIKFQSSVSQIRCNESCQVQTSMPMLTNTGDLVILSISNSLLETLASLHRSTFAQLAILSVNDLQNNEVDMAQVSVKDMLVNAPISSSNRKVMEGFLEQLPENLNLFEVLNSGYRLDNNKGSFLLNLLFVEPDGNDKTYVLFVHDISDVSLAHQQYQTRVILISLTVVILSSLALFFMTMQFRSRLILLAQQLPLLAEKKYSEFKANKFYKNKFFIDEIELLQDSASLLGKELESLDLTIEKNTRELENIAMNDWLTGLPNRNMLNLQIEKLLLSLGDTHQKLTVLLLDFDQFRKINDSHGHDVGDIFLIHAAKRIAGCIDEKDLLFRFGGDEFVLIILEKSNQDRAPIMASKIIDSFREPIAINELIFYTSASIGIFSTEDSSSKIDDLIRRSDLAMYASKDAGGGQYSIFNEKMQINALRKVEIEKEVRDALDKGEFSFALQPQVDISSGKLLGFEALIRWFHPVRGFVPPDEFIPVIENSGYMLEIGYWGIKRAFLILQRLDELGFKELKVAVNLSASQFLDPDLIPFLEGQLKTFERDASQIELELTERTLVADIEQTLETMQQLKKRGFIFSIDDFGTGYSSLAYLKQMPVDIIKIDRSFVSNMENNSADMQIVSSIIAMVKKLGMTVVAEGVENSIQMKMLKNLECTIGQGYFISRPIPESDLYELLPDKIHYQVWDGLDNLD
ncbi:EAL domain-containing protein [Paraglaciecola aquimarina]|uniref:EAL domain-containing protein n=1 Tax=Paraglaciecola algarum TaxID=3050085 RepID=A0ABS9DET8_9ALTE|nr:bifunctional diguanylate cyclase/phosphodiesterase [Paraglaciecola sp. G1-23]MCF2950304.1 EAL domain-containing protein [Paraglaciecola sp. G1-23]